MSEEIDRFIAEQKQRLAQERQLIEDSGKSPVKPNGEGRKKWQSPENLQPAKQRENAVNGGRSVEPSPRQADRSPQRQRSRQATPQDMFTRLGEYERSRRHLATERQEEYNHLQKNSSHKNKDFNDENEGSLPLNHRDSASVARIRARERNEEYNTYLRIKAEKEEQKKLERRGLVARSSPRDAGRREVPSRRTTPRRKPEPRPNPRRTPVQGPSPRRSPAERVRPDRYEGRQTPERYVPSVRQTPDRYEPRDTREQTPPRHTRDRYEPDQYDARETEELRRAREYGDAEDRRGPDRYSPSPQPAREARYRSPEKQRARYQEPDDYPDRSRSQPPPATRDLGNSLPINDRASAKVRQQQERNREYNEFLRKKESKAGRAPPVREGWNSPSYGELLAQKRKEESQYRRAGDPSGGMPLGGENYVRASRSEGFLESEQRLKDLDAEYEAKKREILREKRSNVERHRSFDSNDGERQFGQWDGPVDTDPRGGLPPGAPLRRRPSPTPLSEFYATLPIGEAGGNRSASATQRLKDQYRRDLDQQMNELTTMKRRSHPLPEPPQTEPQYNFNSPVAAAPPAATQPQYRPRVGLSERDEGGAGILDRGFSGLFAPASLNDAGYSGPLAGNPGQLAGTTGQLSSLGPYNSPLDEAYYYYAMKDPLSGLSPANGVATGPTTLPGETARSNPTRGTPTLAYQFDGSGESDQSRAVKAQDYSLELRKQMEETRMHKESRRQREEEYAKRLEEQSQEYNPWGKAGAGAPLRDAYGRPVADLKQMRAENVNRERGVAAPEPAEPVSVGPLDPAYAAAPPPPAAATNEGTFARGGNGIFGEPKSDLEKTAADRYKEELRQQIEDRKREQEERKRQLKEEEDRENARIQADLRKIQDEYEAEQKRLKDKEKAKQERENELAKRHQEEQEEIKRRKREAAEKRRQEQAELREQELQQRLAAQQQESNGTKSPSRLLSPPIPTLAKKDEEQPSHEVEEYVVNKPVAAPERAKSPPVPALKTEKHNGDHTDRWQDPPPRPSARSSRPPSATVLGQLDAIRKQLHSERERVQDQLNKQQYEVQVYDERLSQKPTIRAEAVDVFEKARNRGAASVRRGSSTQRAADTSALGEFSRLRKGSSESRRELASQYPQQPTGGASLELQQEALLREQQRQLHAAQDKLGAAREPSGLLLQSETAFIDPLDSKTPFPDDFDGLRRRGRDTARGVSAMTTGSQNSLNVDALQERNRQRMQRLSDMQDPYIEGAKDSEDILDRFMKKQSHERRPSANTLLDDTWLAPGVAEQR